MPVFNGEAYLEESLHSALDQKFDGELEILCVDDGSRDKSVAIAERNGCRVIRQMHGGISRACNNGLKQASGDFIIFLDQDDLLLPGALAAFLNNIGDFALCEGMACDFLSPDLSPAEKMRLKPRQAPYHGLLTGSCLIMREAALANGPFNEEYKAGQAVDWLLRLRASHASARLDQATVKRRLHASNTSRVSRSEQWRDYGRLLRAKVAGE